MSKKSLLIFGALVLLVFGGPASPAPLSGVPSPGLIATGGPAGVSVAAGPGRPLESWNAFIEAAAARGDLVARSVQLSREGTLHQRLDQFYHGLPVWGGQLIRHYRSSGLSFINGRYFSGIAIDTRTSLSSLQAVTAVRASLKNPVLSLRSEPSLVILPLPSGYALAYKVLFGKRGQEMLSFVDARTGRVWLQYDDNKIDAAIGLGTGVHGDTKKVSVDSVAAGYRAWDRTRPAPIKTFDFLDDFSAWWEYTYTDDDLGFDDDNQWTATSQRPIVDAHDYVGWTYDYYFAVHGRHGTDDADGLIKVNTNFDVWGENNAFYDGSDKSLNFYSGDQVTFTDFSGALDVVAHEYTHAVTDATSRLAYLNESGALNEAFSDIMGACVEFYFQPPGTGFLKADWLCGEDALITFDESKVLRRMDKPYLLLALGTFPYPDHWSLRYTGSEDNGGVHINSSIANQWFYLLTVGGRNRTSGVAVPGIGLAKSERVAYEAWTFYLFPSAGFHDARVACGQAARDLFGAGSAGVTAVATAWRAVGID